MSITSLFAVIRWEFVSPEFLFNVLNRYPYIKINEDFKEIFRIELMRMASRLPQQMRHRIRRNYISDEPTTLTRKSLAELILKLKTGKRQQLCHLQLRLNNLNQALRRFGDASTTETPSTRSVVPSPKRMTFLETLNSSEEDYDQVVLALKPKT
jgi:hypothetical protein